MDANLCGVDQQLLKVLFAKSDRQLDDEEIWAHKYGRRAAKIRMMLDELMEEPPKVMTRGLTNYRKRLLTRNL